MEQSAHSANENRPWQRYVPLAVWVTAVLLGLLIPLKIIGDGYIPGDDAMCHVAKAIADKAWPEILVVRTGCGDDAHPVWHAVLGSIHRGSGCQADGLMMFLVAAPFLIFWLAMLVWRRRPEAFLAAMFAGSLAAPATFARLLSGQPSLFNMAAFVVVLQLSSRTKKIPAWLLVLAVALLGVLGWDRGNAVAELQPVPGDLIFVFVVVLTLLWRVARGGWSTGAVRNPLFVLAVLGWVLGLQAGRFWTDWGFPAALLWLAVEWEEVLEARLDYSRLGAVALTGFVAAGVFIATTRDVGGRWTASLTQEFISPETPGIAGWLPEQSGIVYHANRDLFSRLFYKNPEAEWRYISGLEPGMMPEDDSDILQAIQASGFALESYAPWVNKMRLADRLILWREDARPPDIKKLEWHRSAGSLWIGRLPRGK